MAQVGDLGLLGGLAKSRGRLALAGAASLVVNVAMGVGIARFVNETSGSVVVNMGLITLQFFVALFCGYVLAMLAGALIFGVVWRRQTLLGEGVEDEGVAALRDHSLAFYGVFALCTSRPISASTSPQTTIWTPTVGYYDAALAGQMTASGRCARCRPARAFMDTRGARGRRRSRRRPAR